MPANASMAKRGAEYSIGARSPDVGRARSGSAPVERVRTAQRVELPTCLDDFRTVLVTGGAGFLGSHLVDSLIGAGCRVVVVDDLSSGREANLHPAAELHRVDIRDAAAARIIEQIRPSAVLHLAAQVSVPASTRDPMRDAETNVLGTLNLMEAVRKIGDCRFLFVSTGGAIYGEPEDMPVDETAAKRPASPYGASKLAAENYLATYGAAYDFDYTVVRPANLFGPRQNAAGEAGVVAIFANAMLAGEAVKIFGDGDDERDFVYVSDAVDCIRRALVAGKRTAYNVGTGTGTSIHALFEELVSLTGYAKAPEHIGRRPGDLCRITLDASRAKRDLNWAPRTPLAEGLRRTVDYYRDA